MPPGEQQWQESDANEDLVKHANNSEPDASRNKRYSQYILVIPKRLIHGKSEKHQTKNSPKGFLWRRVGGGSVSEIFVDDIFEFYAMISYT